MYKKNETNYQLQKKLSTYETTIDKQEIEKAYRKQKNMIISEGAVFGLSILFGLLLINRAYRSELRLNQRLNDFLLSVTHELKTPIASLQLVNKTLQRKGLDEGKRAELLKTGWDESLRLESQVNNILAAAQIEQSYKFNFEKINLSDIVEARVGRFRKMFPDRTIDIVENMDSHAMVDPESIHRVIDNLIHNALKYTSEKSKVELAVTAFPKSVQVSVMDQGHGIPASERNRIWDKFYRIGNEETREQPGTGLGLWIAKEIVSSHKGQLDYKPNTPQGSNFIITLPKAS